MDDIFVVIAETGEYESWREYLICYFTSEEEAKAFVNKTAAVVSSFLKEFELKCAKYWQALRDWETANPLPRVRHHTQSTDSEFRAWLQRRDKEIGLAPETKLEPLSGTPLYDINVNNISYCLDISFSYYKVSPGSHE